MSHPLPVGTTNQAEETCSMEVSFHTPDIRSNKCDNNYEDLKKKMTTLLASYRREKSRIKKSHLTGSAAGTVYVSKWFAFNEFDFMADKNTPNNTVDTLPDEPGTSHCAETSGFEYQNEELAVEGITSSRTPEAPRRKRTRTDPKSASAEAKENQTMLLEAFDILKSSVTTPTDPYFTYGQYIANELRKYDPSTLSQVKRAINNVIFEADIGNYTQNYSQSGRSESVIRTPTATSSPASVQTTSLATTYLTEEENQANEAVGTTNLEEVIGYFSSNIE
ncbi:uncharacterized protein LOC110840689 isoform X2 [Zootermopsis nevadensis]|nr:uncharacterized protein LOC110840689 isoform X2 [Zootermopsis nevadensis]XP_021941599.1 uncharacterized protein LOC110840689 isoform X2 [Zootermopsis nevadensis]XP_021941600.1 uncharacterized protein LOC110840689 isoform X2 [Zootermopsis nevadensis]